MNTCIYSKTEFENATGEHIMQNSLGARWTSKFIVCDAVQSGFAGTIDAALDVGFQPIRTLLGAEGGRGGDAPTLKNIKDSTGQKYQVGPGGQPMLAEPIVKVSEKPGGATEVQFKLGTEKQLGWAIAKLQKEYPNIKIDLSKIRESMVKKRDYLSKPLNLNLAVGGPEFFRGVLKSILNLVGVTNPKIALFSELDEVRDFILTGKGKSDSFARFVITDSPFPLPQNGDFAHFIGAWSTGSKIYGIAQYYGEIPFLIRLSENYQGDPFSVGYLVNPLRDTDPAENRLSSFDFTALPSFDDCPDRPGPPTWAAFQSRLSRVLGRYMRRADRNHMGELVEEALEPLDGNVLQKADTQRILETVLPFFEHKLGVNPGEI